MTIAQLKKHMDARFARLNRRFVPLDAQLDLIDMRLDALSGVLTDVQLVERQARRHRTPPDEENGLVGDWAACAGRSVVDG
jgi:hypothetical protein